MGALTSYLPELITAGGEVGAGVGAGLTAPNPYQVRHPFTGVSADTSMSQLDTGLEGALKAILGKLSAPVSLPDATVQPVRPVGGFSVNDPGGLSTAPSLPGMNFGPGDGTDPNTGGQFHPGVAVGSGGGSAAPVDNQNVATAMRAAPIRNTFTSGSVPSAQQSNMPTDPTSAALAILRHAAVAA